MVELCGVDGIANFSRLWADAILAAKASSTWAFGIPLGDDAQPLQGILHPELREAGQADLVGKCMDLESAYKQLPVAPQHAHLAICGLKNQDSGQVELFELAALPFGASAAVHGFNRVAHALEAILRDDLGLPCTHYVDDFTLVLPRAFGEKMVERSKQAPAKLGWAVAPSKKDLPLSPRFIALG